MPFLSREVYKNKVIALNQKKAKQTVAVIDFSKTIFYVLSKLSRKEPRGPKLCIRDQRNKKDFRKRKKRKRNYRVKKLKITENVIV